MLLTAIACAGFLGLLGELASAAVANDYSYHQSVRKHLRLSLYCFTLLLVSGNAAYFIGVQL